MSNPEWTKEFPFAITVCDRDGKILDMNDKAADTFAKWGGYKLLGSSLMNCHNVNSVEIIQKMINDASSNIYTVEKEGRKKLICQVPWYREKEIMGLVEISIPLPDLIENRKRD